ncbi:MAG: hypothetical protein ABH969_09590 [Pseudomonadota bacterium]
MRACERLSKLDFTALVIEGSLTGNTTDDRSTITDDTLPGGPRERTITYTAPFDRCDREADYATAWAAFEKRGKAKE